MSLLRPFAASSERPAGKRAAPAEAQHSATFWVRDGAGIQRTIRHRVWEKTSPQRRRFRIWGGGWRRGSALPASERERGEGGEGWLSGVKGVGEYWGPHHQRCHPGKHPPAACAATKTSPGRCGAMGGLLTVPGFVFFVFFRVRKNG